MRRGPGRHRLHDAWWTLILFAVIGVAVLVTAVSFTGSLRSTVPVTLTADRSGLVMDSGAKVMMRGVQVGRVAQIGRIEWAQNGASLRLEIDPDQIRYIPANVEAQISATTAFGAKFVDLVMPQNPSRAQRAPVGPAPGRIAAVVEIPLGALQEAGVFGVVLEQQARGRRQDVGRADEIVSAAAKQVGASVG